MTTFSDYSQVSQESVGIGGPISDSQDRQSQSSVSNHISDRQYIQFPLLDVLTSSGTCETIQCSGNKALLYLYESTMDSLGLQETINPTMINDEQVASAAIYGPSVGVDHADWAVYPTPKSTEREEINDCEAAHLFFSTPGNGSGMGVPLAKNNTVCWKMKKIKTDCGSVLETNVPVLLKKPKRDRCNSSFTSSVTKDHENLNPKLDVIKRDAPELLANNVQEEPKTGSQKDYIHVRARRGQATDSHSLAERVRRKKISDRMNVLQNLVPGCRKVTSKALLLEEIINYIQSLKSQVEILSRKLAYIDPICAKFDQQNTGHLSQELLPLQAIPDPTIVYGTAPNYVDHPDKVA